MWDKWADGLFEGDSLWNMASEKEMDGLCDGVMEGLGDSLPMKENDGIGEIRRDEYAGVVDGEYVVEEAEGDPLSSAGVK